MQERRRSVLASRMHELRQSVLAGEMQEWRRPVLAGWTHALLWGGAEAVCA
jgi:hypothetical protein